MRPIFFTVLVLCFSACFAQKFLSVRPVSGGYKQIDLENPPQGFLDALDVVDSSLFEACNLDSAVVFTGIKRAASQIVAGTNYEIVYSVLNYESSVLSVKVFQSLADKEGNVSYEISQCY